MKKYLLPCTCGRSVEVDASQSGLQAECACGALLEVPTMRGLSQLAPATSPEEQTAAGAQPQWGPAQGLMFLGGLVLLVGLAATAYIYPQRPHVTINTAMIEQDIEAMTPEQTWEAWKELRQGLNQGANELSTQYQAAMYSYYRYFGMAIAVALVGAALVVSGLVLKFGRRPPRRA